MKIAWTVLTISFMINATLAIDAAKVSCYMHLNLCTGVAL